MLVRGRLPYWLGSGSQSYLQSWSSPFTWMLRRRGPTGQLYVIPLLFIRCDKASVFHLVRNCDVTGSLYGALQPPNGFIDPVFLALGLSPRPFTTHRG